MKKLILITLLSTIAFYSYSQIDVTINPLGSIFSQNVKIGADIALSQRVSLEPILGVKLKDGLILGDAGSYSTMAFLKFYTAKNKRTTGFHVGPWLKFVSRKYDSLISSETNIRVNRFGIGLGLGYKSIIKDKVVLGFDVGAGWVHQNPLNADLGETIINSFVPLMTQGRLLLGYRF